LEGRALSELAEAEVPLDPPLNSMSVEEDLPTSLEGLAAAIEKQRRHLQLLRQQQALSDEADLRECRAQRQPSWLRRKMLMLLASRLKNGGRGTGEHPFGNYELESPLPATFPATTKVATTGKTRVKEPQYAEVLASQTDLAYVDFTVEPWKSELEVVAQKSFVHY